MATTRKGLREVRRSFLESRLLDTLRSESVTLTALAAVLGVSGRTVLRLIRDLRQQGQSILLVNDGRRQAYRLGTIEIPDVRKGTAFDLLNSGFVGMWADRKDIRSSAEFARQLRKRASRRACQPSR
ncbi:MAG: HTH domain-containing protein [Nitrospirae bacterium]|nr:HTH domain-containing protein [Nitrospirota bacterium]